MISTVKEHTSWTRKVFQVKLHISGSTIILFACLLVFSILTLASMFLHKTTFNLMTKELAKEHSNVVLRNVSENTTIPLGGAHDAANGSKNLGGHDQIDTPPTLDVEGNGIVIENVTQPILDNEGVAKENISATLDEEGVAQNSTSSLDVDSRKDPSQPVLDELFAPESDKESCLSRFESSLFRKASPHKPSPYLLSKLRSYEDLHKRCGPYTKPYNKALQQLKSGHPPKSSTECRYVVYTSMSGLGNRMLTISSAFLYALLTNRVLLVQFPEDYIHLFCEPFPNTTWLLPLDNPLRDHLPHTFNQKYPHNYGSMLKNKKLRTKITTSQFLVLYLAYNMDRQDGFFYCDRNQAQLQSVPWLVITSNQYFIPSFFLMKSFKDELTKMFPDKETVFHFLGRYLFQPTNVAWGLITRYHQAYLAEADERIGIQLRVFNTTSTPFQTVMDQILSCTRKEKLLPKLSLQNYTSIYNSTHKTVLVTSLHSEYYENLRDLYWTRPTEAGEVVKLFQPSHEGYEKEGHNMHTMKAWAEIYLLSMSDVLVTSPMSTFGYVAQSIGGLKPWILRFPSNGESPDPSCRRTMSMEPCYHFPPKHDCSGKGKFDAGKEVPYVKNCEDFSWGLKIVNVHG